jgi:hypothetical protein
MKKLFILSTLVAACLSTSAQNKKYISAMEKNIGVLDTTRDAPGLQNLANNFERIAGAEKAEWLPDYYTAFCYVNMTYSVKGDQIDTYCDKAESFLKKADSISPNNSEIYTLKSQIAGARISVNPMARGQKYGTMAAELREKAKELDKTNPRPFYLEGTSLFYTPPMFGGGKDKAKASFLTAQKMYETFTPASTIAPNWGKRSTEYFLKKCDEK